MSVKIMTLEELRIKGMQTLSRELGSFNFIRFFQQYISGYGDYTKERKTILGKKNIDEIVINIKKGKNNNKNS